MSFITPRKCILSKEQLDAFQTSETYNHIITYIETLNNAIVNVKLSDACSESEVRPSMTYDTIL